MQKWIETDFWFLYRKEFVNTNYWTIQRFTASGMAGSRKLIHFLPHSLPIVSPVFYYVVSVTTRAFPLGVPWRLQAYLTWRLCRMKSSYFHFSFSETKIIPEMSLIRLSDVTYLHQNQKLCSRIHWLARPQSREHQWSGGSGGGGRRWRSMESAQSSQLPLSVTSLATLHLFFHFFLNTFRWLLLSTLLLPITKEVPKLPSLSPEVSASHALIPPRCVVPGCRFPPVYCCHHWSLQQLSTWLLCEPH